MIATPSVVNVYVFVATHVWGTVRGAVHRTTPAEVWLQLETCVKVSVVPPFVHSGLVPVKPIAPAAAAVKVATWRLVSPAAAAVVPAEPGSAVCSFVFTDAGAVVATPRIQFSHSATTFTLWRPVANSIAHFLVYSVHMGRAGVDLTGQRFERLVVIRFARTGKHYHRFWLCRCDCGTEVTVNTGNLQGGNVRSCGCLRRDTAHNRQALTGQQFGRLTALEVAPSRHTSKTTYGYWLCECECGTQLEVLTSNLTGGNSRSCGCLSRDAKQGNQRGHKHGHNTGNSPTYRSWNAMLKRCRNPNPWYSDRGITFDPRWQSFENFLVDMGERPQGCTLDRIDNDGPYSPENCRWATPVVQCNNKSNHQYVTHKGRTQTVAQWAREVGLPANVLGNRIVIYNWDVERALTTPVRRHPKR